ncbi:hypothetical protein WJX73_010189 [Symbiochloris irregularis]|uniref:Uncharacterized protein n=1 Tax=Symbiochloris irregularis TaxID=706552 RepID=A0AAW1PXT1_9CHLO
MLSFISSRCFLATGNSVMGGHDLLQRLQQLSRLTELPQATSVASRGWSAEAQGSLYTPLRLPEQGTVLAHSRDLPGLAGADSASLHVCLVLSHAVMGPGSSAFTSIYL